MKLSVRASNGMRLCFMLALSKAPLSASQLVKQTDVGIKYLEQLLAMLRRGEIVKAYRGKSGGYVLSREPEKITVGDMLRALDDGFELPNCAQGICGDGDACGCAQGVCDDAYCPNRNVFTRLGVQINELFDGITLADIVNDYRGACGATDKS